MAARDGVTSICSSGNTRRSSSAQALTSTSTRRSKLRERSSSSQISSDTSPGALPCTRICVGVMTCAKATAGSVTEIRFKRSAVLISSDLPTRGAEGGVGSDCGGRVVVCVPVGTFGGDWVGVSVCCCRSARTGDAQNNRHTAPAKIETAAFCFVLRHESLRQESLQARHQVGIRGLVPITLCLRPRRGI